jgi:predicted membrane-bound mannosyltransferase
MHDTQRLNRWLIALTLVVTALVIRVWNIGERTISHLEAYAPGIA